MLRKWRPLGVILISLTPGKPVLFWAWTTKKSNRSLPLGSHLALASKMPLICNKFEHDFLASNLPEGKCIKPPPSTAKWYKVGQPCYEDKIQELITDFSKICISPKPSGAPMGKVPLLVCKAETISKFWWPGSRLH